MTYTTLKKEQRKACWIARDNYFQCLDAINWTDVATDNSSKCENLKKLFIERCPGSWVDHFSQLRSADARQKAYENLMNNPEYKK